MDVAAAVVADFETSVLVDGGEGPFDDVAVFAEARPVGMTFPGEDRGDADAPEECYVGAGGVGPVAVEFAGRTPGDP